MMRRPPKYHPLLQLAGTVLKYYLLNLFCLAVLCLVLGGIGATSMALMLLATVGSVLLRLAVFVFCLVAVAVIAEAWRYW